MELSGLQITRTLLGKSSKQRKVNLQVCSSREWVMGADAPLFADGIGGVESLIFQYFFPGIV